MRLWTVHPQYLDSKGLVALWRESLLAQAVLRGETHGYRHHPQLQRFRDAASPLAAIAAYLTEVAAEAKNRNYNFAANKIGAVSDTAVSIIVTQGQLEYEWQHLVAKLTTRAPLWYANYANVQQPQPHPIFRIVPGPVADWEVRKSKTGES